MSPSRVLLLLPLLAVQAAAFGAQGLMGVGRGVQSAPVCRLAPAVTMSDAPKKKYRPTSFGVNPRVYKDRKRNLYNRYYKSTQATALKKVDKAIQAGDKEEATKLFSLAMSVIDKNVKRGIIHKKNGARRKSRWSKKVAQAGSA